MIRTKIKLTCEYLYDYARGKKFYGYNHNHCGTGKLLS